MKGRGCEQVAEMELDEEEGEEDSSEEEEEGRSLPVTWLCTIPPITVTKRGIMRERDS